MSRKYGKKITLMALLVACILMASAGAASAHINDTYGIKSPVSSITLQK